MEINWENIGKAINAWITSELAVTSIKMNQNGPRPALPYFAYDVSTANPLGHAEKRAREGEPGIFDVVRVYDTTINIQAYGPGAYQKLHDLMRTTDFDRVMTALSAAGISIYNRESVEDITSVIGTGFEERATVDIFCYITEKVKEDLSWIETFELNQA